ncbi:hypothetical protein, partial [Micromonospora sp. WMMD737]|uniref:hypothetical protein n=1 Tax=Micromonospora sp. WMMD737 TaxID=3404113 RepID=UPI003B95F970
TGSIAVGVGMSAIAVGALSVGAASADPLSDSGTDCGAIAFPDNEFWTGRSAPVRIVEGSVSCNEALSVLDRYIHGVSYPEGGNYLVFPVDDWTCQIPYSGAMLTECGCSVICGRPGDRIITVNY